MDKGVSTYTDSLSSDFAMSHDGLMVRSTYIDLLTGLYRLEFMADAVSGLIKGVELKNIALMMLSISRFRDTSIVFDHDLNNAILVHAAKRLLITKEGMVARLDSNRFLILLNDSTNVKKLEKHAKAIRAAFKEPLRIGGEKYYINFKIGIAMNECDTCDFFSALRDAEAAVDYIEKDYINDICVINDEIREDLKDYYGITYELRRAMEKDELDLLFQPIMNADTKKIAGAEVLVSWKNQRRGVVSTTKFIQLAEQTGIIKEVGDYVLKKSLTQLKECLKIDSNFFISINISVIQLMSSSFVEYIDEMIAQYELSPWNLVFEITESVFITDMAKAVKVLKKIRKHGIRISLDDFGTGYSSLSYLKILPIQNIKIDRSFIQDVAENPAAETILKAIISLGHKLEKSITVEGVENEEHIKLLESQGCSYLQGYYFSKPVPLNDLLEYMLRHCEE